MTDSLRPLMPRAMPSAGFVHDLDEDVRRAARQRMEQLGILPAVSFEEMVIELRKLVRLLRKTLVPVSPGNACVQRINRQLQRRAKAVHSRPMVSPQRWLMFGGLLGSALSIGGLLAALLLRRRDGDEAQD